MANLLAADIDTDRFIDLVRNHPWPENTYLIGFAPGRARFERFRFDPEFLSCSDQGRIFSPQGELRWRRIDDLVRTVYLGEPPLPLVLEDYSHELAGLNPVVAGLLLWGRRTDSSDEWIEQQIPLRLQYPIDTADYPRGRVELVLERWVDNVGLPRFSRYHSLAERGDY